MPDFLDLLSPPAADLQAMLTHARWRKSRRGGRPLGAADDDQPLAGRLGALLFEKPSTRTRLSFDAGLRQLGGQPVVIGAQEAQWIRGETPEDTAKVLSRYVDLLVLRLGDDAVLRRMAQASAIPVINGLTGSGHPCQILADLMTFAEHKGALRGRVLAWYGDGNNMLISWLEAAPRFDFILHIAVPPEDLPARARLQPALDSGHARLFDDPLAAAAGADCVMTDVWSSKSDEKGGEEKGDKEKSAARRRRLARFRVGAAVMQAAAEGAIFMHCLPAHRGEEVEAGVIDGKQSVVFDEAENRLHIQKAIMLWCCGAPLAGV